MKNMQYYKTEIYKKDLHTNQSIHSDLTNSVVLWNTVCDDSPPIIVTHWPDYDSLAYGFQSSWGACDREVNRASFQERKEMLCAYFFRWLLRDEIPALELHQSLIGLNEYREMLSDDVLYDPDLKRTPAHIFS